MERTAKSVNRKSTTEELEAQIAELEGKLDRAERGRDSIHKKWRETHAKLLDYNLDGLHLKDDNVEWVVNTLGELGVKVGDQLFFLYKGRSLVYSGDDIEEGTSMRWRPVYKREFGECCHPPPKTEYSRDRGEREEDGTYTFGSDEHWQEFPAVKKGS